MRWTIRTRLFALSFLGLLLAVAVGASGYFGVSQVQSGIQEIYVTSSALRNHLEADMMRHALKGDVQAALLARSDKDKDRVLADLSIIPIASVSICPRTTPCRLAPTLRRSCRKRSRCWKNTSRAPK